MVDSRSRRCELEYRAGRRNDMISDPRGGDRFLGTDPCVFPAEWCEGSAGLRAARGVEDADRQWSDREHDPPCGELAVEGGEYLLAQEKCGSGSVVAFVLQGGALEPS